MKVISRIVFLVESDEITFYSVSSLSAAGNPPVT
jgi:hypothetical protein